MKKIVTLLMVFITTLSAVQAQKINGTVKDETGKTLNGATVSLKRARDSSLVKLSVTPSSGKYEFVNIADGKYFITVSFISHNTFSSPAFEVSGSGDVTGPDVVLVKTSGNLKEVVVESKKPIVEVRADKTILNVEGTINSVGQDALELLRKSPGVLIDKDDNISLSGKNGVQVYVDGKPTPISGADLAAYLKTLQSAQIEAIEIITNPSAKYDAAGNAGIINIRLKKNKAFGTNGSINTGYGIGVYSKYNSGISLNHRNKNINVFGNYNYNNSINENVFRLYRDVADTIFDNKSRGRFKNNNHGFKAGLDYFVNKTTTVGVMVNGNIAENKFSNLARTPIIYKPTGITDRILVADNKTNVQRNNANFNFNYRYADAKKRELNIDADYGLFRIDNDQWQPNVYYDGATGSKLREVILNMIAPTNIDIYTFKTDYETNYKKGRLGIGGKSSYVKSFNDFQRYDVYPSGKELDKIRSNVFKYNENINAVYVNYNRQFKGFMIQAGLRMENTNAEGRSIGLKEVNNVLVPYDSSFKRHYTNLFPSAAITLNKKPTNQWSFSYSRRIDRPAYQDLNPFEFKLDEYTYQKGNTELRPQYTNIFSITNNYKYKLTTTLSYSHVNEVFSQLVDVTDKSKSFITKKNLATQDIVSLNISYPFSYKWYSVFGNLNGYYSHFKANYGSDRNIDIDVFAFNIYMQHSAKLGKGYTAELSGWYNSPSIWQGTFKSKELWSVDAGLQKQLWKGKATAKISVSDIFFTIKWRGVSDYANQHLIANGYGESRQLKLNFTYRFGNSQVKAARNRKSGLDDESKRVGNQGGGLSN